MPVAKTIDDLQASLADAFDLTKVDDCRQVIEVLLRSSDADHSNAQTTNQRLKQLALLVVEDSPNAKHKALEVLEHTNKVGDKDLFDFFVKMTNETGLAQSLTLKQLVDETMVEVWSTLPMDSRGSALLGELLCRVKQLPEL